MKIIGYTLVVTNILSAAIENDTLIAYTDITALKRSPTIAIPVAILDILASYRRAFRYILKTSVFASVAFIARRVTK